MTKKGKKKRQEAAASTSKQTSGEKVQEQSSQQQQEKQQQTSSEALPSTSTQTTKGKKKHEAAISTSKQASDEKSQQQSSQQQESLGSRQIPQDQPQGASSHPGQQVPQSQPQQQPQRAWSQPQQPQGVWGRPLQQIPQSQPQQQQPQGGRGRSQQHQLQGASSHPGQQVTQSQPQQQPQRAWSQPQQPQGVWGRPLQQIPQSQPQQQQPQDGRGRSQQHQPQGASSHPGQQVPQSQPQQQPQRAWSQPQQPQGVCGRPLQQIPQSQPQQQQPQDGRGRSQQHQPQGALSHPGQQVPQSQPQQQPQRAWSQPQQPQGVWGRPLQQIPQSQPQQQQPQDGRGRSQQHQPQGASSHPGQQVPQSQPQQQPQRAWSQPQQPQGVCGRPLQQIPQSQPQQQQPQDGRGRSQQHQPQGASSHPGQQVPQSQPQQQPQRAWSQPQQPQGVWGRPLQHQLQGEWACRQQQMSQSQSQQQQQQPGWGPQQQQGAPTLPQQQQKALIDTGAAGDCRQVQAIGVDQQLATSTASLNISERELALTDPFHKEKTEKAKMLSKDLKLYHEMIPKRGNPLTAGKVGQNITVFTNMYQIIFNDKFVTNAVHYDINICPFKEEPRKEDIKKETRLPKILCRSIFEQCRHKHFDKRFPAYDGNKNAYSANDLPFSDNMQDVFSFVNERGQRKQYKITLKKVANIDLSWIKNLRPGLAGNRDQTAIQVLDIIMRHAPESKFINIGRSLFWDIDKTNEPLGGGLTLGHGGFLSGVLGWQPYLNVDVAHKGFTMNLRVLEYIADVTRMKEEDLTHRVVMNYRPKILGFLRGLKVTYAIPNSPISKRTYRVLDLWPDSCESHTFTSSDEVYTITKYFREIKKYNIKRIDLPTLHVGKTSTGGKVLVPLELCTIVSGQAFNKKLDENQTTNMIKNAATPAFIRKQNIEKAFSKMEINHSSVMEKEFHLSVSSKMKVVDARVLPPPELKYARSTTKVAKGTWRLQQFNQAKNLESTSWTVLNLTGKPQLDPVIQTFVEMLQRTAKEVGMDIGVPKRPFKSFHTSDLKSISYYFNEHKSLKLIIVIIPDFTDVTYGNVKKITEMDIGVLTQCMKFKTLRSINPPTIKNLLQKINSKLNGINHTLDKMPSCLSNFCMLVGADVTHPAPESKDVPSIAAVAASRNNLAFQYNVTLRLQPPKEEMILDLEAIILSQLNIYHQETKSPPQRIIYYRDGVSEGQLPQVMYYEITAIKNAIKTFNKGNIEVTCLVVQKRHHVRLFPTDRNESDDRNGNVRAGTIVDKTITHPDHIDFYLVSHASIQGTARPTKYRCICNDSKFNEDQLEEMTYFLCHTYARCTRSVSYPAPTYYAHLAAFRGRALLQGNPNFNLADLEREQRNFRIRMGASPMYFV